MNKERLFTGEQIDSYKPDYSKSCDVCGRPPVVTGVRSGNTVFASSLCGVCNWGEAIYFDPKNWKDIKW